ncbi:MAG: cation transporter, partial [Actinomycetota bacterium]|nr:cation transporter [Actinomycetota bacterium]
MNSTTTKQIYRIGVQGMDCASCEQLLQKHVLQVTGVSTAFADAGAGSLTIYAEADVSTEAIVAAIVESGFVPDALGDSEALAPVVDLLPTTAVLGLSEATTPAPAPACPAPEPVSEPAPVLAESTQAEATATSTTLDATFAVSGMTCSSCAGVIEKVLGKTEGVTSATVNLATEKLAVTYDPALIDIDGIVAKVK